MKKGTDITYQSLLDRGFTFTHYKDGDLGDSRYFTLCLEDKEPPLSGRVYCGPPTPVL